MQRRAKQTSRTSRGKQIWRGKCLVLIPCTVIAADILSFRDDIGA
jgi:hypothetical protein